MSFTDLGKATGLSTSAVHQRVKRLEGRGLITGYAARLDHSQLGRPIAALVSVTVPSEIDFATIAAGYPEIESCWSVAGATDGFVIKLRVSAPAALDRLLSSLRARTGAATSTTLLLGTAFEDRPPAD